MTSYAMISWNTNSDSDMHHIREDLHHMKNTCAKLQEIVLVFWGGIGSLISYNYFMKSIVKYSIKNAIYIYSTWTIVHIYCVACNINGILQYIWRTPTLFKHWFSLLWSIVLCWIQFSWCVGCWVHITHWGRDKMTTISQTTLSNAFSSMKMLEIRYKFHWSLFLRVQLTIFQHWFR